MNKKKNEDLQTPYGKNPIMTERNVIISYNARARVCVCVYVRKQVFCDCCYYGI